MNIKSRMTVRIFNDTNFINFRWSIYKESPIVIFQFKISPCLKTKKKQKWTWNTFLLLRLLYLQRLYMQLLWHVITKVCFEINQDAYFFNSVLAMRFRSDCKYSKNALNLGSAHQLLSSILALKNKAGFQVETWAHHWLVTSMTVTNVGNEMCWWQF